jgi:hypothetical protein
MCTDFALNILMGSEQYQHDSCKNFLGHISYLIDYYTTRNFIQEWIAKTILVLIFLVSLDIFFFTAEMEGTYQWMLVFFICVITLPTLLSEKCFSRSQKTHLYLATKSPYRYLINKNDSAVHYPGKTFAVLSIPSIK